MRYIFLFYDEKYSYRDIVPTKNLPLDDLFEFLDYKDYKDCWIKLEEDEKDPRKVIIWSEYNLKPSLSSDVFDTYEEDIAHGEQYSKYAMKRFYEMPAIRIFRDNYDFLEQQWQEIRKRKPKYLIVREHDNGYVDIIEKDELSPEDIAIMNREHKIFQNYIKRWNEYVKAHPEKRSKVWRSPEDSEFESDFALYDPIDEQGID